MPDRSDIGRPSTLDKKGTLIFAPSAEAEYVECEIKLASLVLTGAVGPGPSVEMELLDAQRVLPQRVELDIEGRVVRVRLSRAACQAFRVDYDAQIAGRPQAAPAAPPAPPAGGAESPRLAEIRDLVSLARSRLEAGRGDPRVSEVIGLLDATKILLGG